mmetsp:Transcript_4407/g.7277  ORF Transcript_4407/g.7277 Transcript_4407/m.7277 type:complete len:214 (-) Transcript_4407:2675-3316(-)
MSKCTSAFRCTCHYVAASSFQPMLVHHVAFPLCSRPGPLASRRGRPIFRRRCGLGSLARLAGFITTCRCFAGGSPFGSCILCLLLNQANQHITPPGQLLRGSALEVPVKPESPALPDLSLEIVPHAIAQLVDLTQDEAVLLLCVGLALVGAVGNLQFLPRVLVPLQLAGDGCHDILLALNLELSPLHVLDHLLPLVQLLVTIPKDFAVSRDLL